ncbi:serine hydrolase domain-containing protein [Pedobacter sp. JY14-1]|uniref:serine hydrolase domain-containing protein n=1 Tax=Pedobacter sp. JY14-1 TaxID=3034151 RepID=UPI0023E21588|nr:serine hydrolase domain-containing protein [Pedobacter sp. JY14-1]
MLKRFSILILASALLLTATPSVAQLPAKLDSIVQTYTGLGEFNGTVLVAQRGKILLNKGYGLADQDKASPNKPETIFGIASITKTFTSTLVLKLAEQKKLAISDKINKYFPELRNCGSITIGHLLSHTSGISDRAIEEKFRNVDLTAKTLEEKLMIELDKTPLALIPGTTFSYSNRGYYLLGYLIAKITNMSYEQAVSAYILKPYRLKNSGFDFAALPQNQRAKGYWAENGKNYDKETPLNDPRITFAAGALYSTVGDLYRWHQVLQQGKFISEKSQDLAYKKYSPTYGYGFQIDSVNGQQLVSHSGGFWGFRSNFARIPKDDICVILLSNHEVSGLGEITRNLLQAVYHLPVKLPVKRIPVQVSREILERYTGNYEISAPPLKLEVKLEEKGLVVYPFQGPKSELAALDASHFYDMLQESIEITFEEQNGEKQMRIKINGNERIALKKGE